MPVIGIADLRNQFVVYQQIDIAIGRRVRDAAGEAKT